MINIKRRDYTLVRKYYILLYTSDIRYNESRVSCKAIYFLSKILWILAISSKCCSEWKERFDNETLLTVFLEMALILFETRAINVSKINFLSQLRLRILQELSVVYMCFKFLLNFTKWYFCELLQHSRALNVLCMYISNARNKTFWRRLFTFRE